MVPVVFVLICAMLVVIGFVVAEDFVVDIVVVAAVCVFVIGDTVVMVVELVRVVSAVSTGVVVVD